MPKIPNILERTISSSLARSEQMKREPYQALEYAVDACVVQLTYLDIPSSETIDRMMFDALFVAFKETLGVKLVHVGGRVDIEKTEA